MQAPLLLGADVNQSVDDGETSVHCASRKGHLNILIKLAQLNANLNQPDKNGRTALYRAAYDGLGLIVSELIRLGADPNLPSHEGVTPLFIAAQKGHLDVVNNILTGSRAIEYMPFKTTPVKLMEFGFTVHHPYFFGRAVRSRIKQLIQSKSLSVHDHATAIYLLPEDIALIMGHQAIVARLDRFGCEHGVPLAQLVMRANELVPHNNTQATRGAWSRWVHFFSPEQSYQRFEREHDVPLSEAPIQVCKTM